MNRHSMPEVLLDIAFVMAHRATCQRAHVGAVVARSGRILSSGYNGAPAGMPHCEHPPDGDSELSRQEHCGRAVHAEANAVAFAARYGVALDGADLFCTMAPCVKCAQLIINAGIRTVTYEESYRDGNGVALLREAGLTVVCANAKEVLT